MIDVINKIRNKVLFNELLVTSELYIKYKTYYRNGLQYKAYPIENTLLNKFLIKI